MAEPDNGGLLPRVFGANSLGVARFVASAAGYRPHHVLPHTAVLVAVGALAVWLFSFTHVVTQAAAISDSMASGFALAYVGFLVTSFMMYALGYNATVAEAVLSTFDHFKQWVVMHNLYINQPETCHLIVEALDLFWKMMIDREVERTRDMELRTRISTITQQRRNNAPREDNRLDSFSADDSQVQMSSRIHTAHTMRVTYAPADFVCYFMAVINWSLGVFVPLSLYTATGRSWYYAIVHALMCIAVLHSFNMSIALGDPFFEADPDKFSATRAMLQRAYNDTREAVLKQIEEGDAERARENDARRKGKRSITTHA